MTTIAETRAAMLAHVPKSAGELRNALLGADSWHWLARAVVDHLPDWRDDMTWPSWEGSVVREYICARPRVPDARGG